MRYLQELKSIMNTIMKVFKQKWMPSVKIQGTSIREYFK